MSGQGAIAVLLSTIQVFSAWLSSRSKSGESDDASTSSTSIFILSGLAFLIGA